MTFPWLVADIGGINAQFGLVERRGDPPARVDVLAYRDHAGLSAAAATYLARHAGDLRPRAACVAVAGPLDGATGAAGTAGAAGAAAVPWADSMNRVRADLALEHVELINDFEALALALPSLSPADLRPIGEPVPAAEHAPRVVLSPGIGLGVAALVPSGGGWVPVSGEGGHVDPPAGTHRELEIVGLLRAELGTASAGALLSADGLARMHRLLARIHGVPADPLSAAQICARRTDPLCGETLETFCALLGSFAGNTALTLGARGGVYLGGGILPRISDVLRRSDFRRRFERKSDMGGYLRTIPTALITAPTPALAGAAAHLSQRLS